MKLVYPSIGAAAGALDVPREKLSHIKRKGAEGFEANGTVNLGKLCAWLVTHKLESEEGGTLEESQRLLNEVKRKKLERLERMAKNELVTMSEVDPWLMANYVTPMMNILASAPHTLAPACNPTDPGTATKAIDDWIENTMKPAMRTGLEKPTNL